TLVAHFEKIPPKQYTVTLSAQPNDGGTVSGAGKFEENTQVTVVATPKEGWRFIRWTESGTEVSTSASY
ncbi:InlB B-repeat-containing protein, partial [Porphyromonas canoris]